MIIQFIGNYSWLSNFEPVDIVLDGKIYPSVEHAYMSAKSNDYGWKEFCSDPSNSASIVKRKSKFVHLVDNWGELRLKVMEECLIQKFSKEPFRSKLIDTGSTYIREGNYWNDRFWGYCLKTNIGTNHLGRLIMKIRDSLKMDNIEIIKNLVPGQWILTCSMLPLQFKSFCPEKNSIDYKRHLFSEIEWEIFSKYDDFETMDGSRHSVKNCGCKPISEKYAIWFIENKCHEFFPKTEMYEKNWEIYIYLVKELAKKHGIEYEGV